MKMSLSAVGYSVVDKSVAPAKKRNRSLANARFIIESVKFRSPSFGTAPYNRGKIRVGISRRPKFLSSPTRAAMVAASGHLIDRIAGLEAEIFEGAIPLFR